MDLFVVISGFIMMYTSHSNPNRTRLNFAENRVTRIFVPYLPIFLAMTAIYMVADDGLHGSELWKSNGNAAGTTLVKDINPNGDGLHPGASFPAAILGSTLLFSANDGQHGWELWRSDGTGTGTVMVKDIRGDGDASSFPWNFTTHGSTVFFTADDRTHGKELWRTDGTSLGTELVKNINTFAESWMTDYDIGLDPATLTSHGAYVYFLASQMELNQSRTGVLCHGKLWRTDGTEAGTIALKQVPGDSCYAGWKIRL